MKKIIIPFLIVWILIGVYYFSGVNKASFNVENVVTSPTPTPIPHLDAYKIYNLVNDYRASKGLNKLVFDPSMCEFTKIRLDQIHSDWSHNGFYPEVLSAYKYTDAGENLGKSTSSEQQTVEFWTKSTTHLEQIVRPAYTRTCIETDKYHGINYVVQEFASY